MTNEFRAEQGLKELIWDKKMYKLANKHSKNMAKGIVQFSHDGFSERVAKMKPYTSAAENVAYNYD